TTIVCRYRGRLTVTPIVKTTFAFFPSGRMRNMPAAPLRDVDCTPWRAQADVIVRTSDRPVRFGLHRDAIVLDQTVGPAENSRESVGASLPAQFRTALAMGLPVISLPDDFDWSTLQVAPPAHRVSFLRGDEWLLVQSQDGTVRTQIPMASATCLVRKLDGAFADQ